MIKITENEVRKRVLQSDNSHYFAKWGSRNPELTIREEIDNQISAKPTIAGISINTTPRGDCEIRTYNDGDIPSPDRMEKMNCIGKSYSDKKGASICGVGQIEGLVAGRKSPNTEGTLVIKSIYNGTESRFECRANGTNYTISTENSGPYPTIESNMIEKTYIGMAQISEDKLKKIRALIAAKIYPYAKAHPEFTYTFNGEKIEPVSVLYEGNSDKRIRRMQPKRYKINYHGKEYEIGVECADVARYVKPNGNNIENKNVNAFDRAYEMTPESSGVFVEVGGVYVITGGASSWNFIGQKYHSTRNGQRVCISIPSDGELKEAIFAESPNKSSINICLNEIRDFNGKNVFESMLNEIKDQLNEWKEKKSTVNNQGKEIKNADEILNSLPKDSTFYHHIKIAIESLTTAQIESLGKKKFKTIFDFIEKNNKKREKCVSCAK